MNRFVVDTNLPVVANGRGDGGGRRIMLACRLAAVEFLEQLLERHRIVLDQAGEIQEEYRRHLSPKGQPGVGDRFYLVVINSHPDRVERVLLRKNNAGQYSEFPDDSRLTNFDPSDRKFAALARQENIPVAHATDSDWVVSVTALRENGITVRHVCGCAPDRWYEND